MISKTSMTFLSISFLICYKVKSSMSFTPTNLYPFHSKLVTKTMKIQFCSHTKMCPCVCSNLQFTNSPIQWITLKMPWHKLFKPGSVHHKYLIGPTELHIKLERAYGCKIVGGFSLNPRNGFRRKINN